MASPAVTSITAGRSTRTITSSSTGRTPARTPCQLRPLQQATRKRKIISRRRPFSRPLESNPRTINSLTRMMMFFEPLEPRQLLAVNVSIDTAQRYQTIDGFGTSMAWWVPGVYEQSAWQDAFYKDLGSSILRVDLNINALPGSDGDFATPVNMVEDLQTNINAFDWNSIPTKRFGAVIQ